MDINKFVKSSAAFIKNINILYASIISIIAVASAVIEYFTGFFTLSVTVPVWLVTILPIVSFALCFLFIHIRNKKLYKKEFVKGETVSVKGYTYNFIVIGYHFWFFNKVKCVLPKQPSKVIYIEEAVLEKQKTVSYSSGYHQRKPSHF